MRNVLKHYYQFYIGYNTYSLFTMKAFIRKYINVFTVIIVVIAAVSVLLIIWLHNIMYQKFWQVSSIDTMKYSRDLARQKLHDPSFDAVIDLQVRQITETGATHIAIDTPYDPEFLPVLKKWVTAARKYNLHIWFRGNFSGWEEWFGYKKISRAQHTEMIKKFIADNRDLFRNGDIFTSCPECENKADIDISNKSDITGYKNFLLNEYHVSQDAFASIGKDVTVNYYSMNKDLAQIMMDPDTTKQFGGVVVIDHYVAKPEQLAEDIRKLAEKSGGKIVLGEFGVPVPDINGTMTGSQQAAWIKQACKNLQQIPELVGVNYWVNAGGTTAIWNDNSQPKPAVDVMRECFSGK